MTYFNTYKNTACQRTINTDCYTLSVKLPYYNRHVRFFDVECIQINRNHQEYTSEFNSCHVNELYQQYSVRTYKYPYRSNSFCLKYYLHEMCVIFIKRTTQSVQCHGFHDTKLRTIKHYAYQTLSLQSLCFVMFSFVYLIPAWSNREHRSAWIYILATLSD